MLIRLAYLTVANTFAVLGLILATDREKETEILVLRHQVAVLERQLGGKKVRFSPADRALLAVLLAPAPEGRAQAPAPGGAPGYRAPLAPRHDRAPVGFQMVYKRLTCGFACGAGRVDGSVAGLWSYGPVALDLWS